MAIKQQAGITKLVLRNLIGEPNKGLEAATLGIQALDLLGCKALLGTEGKCVCVISAAPICAWPSPIATRSVPEGFELNWPLAPVSIDCIAIILVAERQSRLQGRRLR
jgi:hypothetical protein